MASATEPPSSGGSWLLLSDIHFTPYADAHLVDALISAPASQWHAILRRGSEAPSRYGQDTNFALLESALDEMQRVESDPPVVIIAGDFLAHEFPETFHKLEPGKPQAVYEAFVDKTIAFIAFEMNARYPRAQFIITVGNNDGYCGDYRSTPRSPFLAHMAHAWEPLVDRRGASPEFARTFSLGGYYTTSPPTRAPGLVIAANSVFWSALYENACGTPGDDPGRAELAWLSSAGAAPRGGYRWFLTHIPPTMDAYDSMRVGLPIGFMKDADAAALTGDVTDASQRTAAFVMGHTHHPSFAIFGNANAPVPGLVLSSISPVQGNNPAFATALVNQDSGSIEDATTYVLLLGSTNPVWTKEYDFRSVYGSGLSAPSLERVQADLLTNSGRRASFAAYYTSFSLHGGIDAATRAWYWCAIGNVTSVTYMDCVTRTRPRS